VGPPLKEFQKRFPKDVRLVFKHMPLTSIHDNAQIAAEAAAEAHAQKKFWLMHDFLLSNQKALGRAELESHALTVGLNVSKFKAALDSGAHKQAVRADLLEGNRSGVRGTPTVFINGRRYQGPRGYPPEGLEAVARAYLGLK
jgi:protein-disulfide isomerase